MADDKIPQAQAPVLEANGKFTIAWFRFFAALDSIRKAISDGVSAALLIANNLDDVDDPATAFANIKQSASGTTTGVVQQYQPDAWAHTIERVKNVTSRFHFKAPYAGTIDSTYTYCQSGTCTVRWSINGTPVGTQTNSVSTTAQTRTHTTANTFSAGAIITYTITSNSACLEAFLQCDVTYDLAA
jgi:hypothetical protein